MKSRIDDGIVSNPATSKLEWSTLTVDKGVGADDNDVVGDRDKTAKVPMIDT